MPLTDPEIRNAKPADKTKRLYDSRGLYIEITPRGGKYWRHKYRFGGKEKRLSYGVYPEVTLKEARERRDEARRLLRDGLDTSAERKREKARTVERHMNTFEAIAQEWFEKWSPTASPSYSERTWSRLQRFIIPYLGARPLAEIEPPDVLAALRRIEARGTGETAHRVRNVIGQVFRYGVATGRCSRDPTADLRGALGTVKGKHYPAPTDPKRVGELLRMLEAHQGEPVVSAALRLAPMLFVRPGELRKMRWSNLDLEACEWRFTLSKVHTEHLVPLADQAVAIIKELHPLTGHGEHVFRALRGDRPISDAALTAALRRLGIPADELVVHGWRATARTLLHERLNFPPDIIERQLGHRVPDRLGAAYNRTRFLDERRKMMQAYADYLDVLKNDTGKVLPLQGRRA